ncbi:Similar to S.cerevisiae protein ECM16 (Essential DEAH-box ATP-dependent RNA helicase specific to U3 snoRNP) [Malassezia sympodialis ATCC 42132]|uniref:RNA helicase n=1 Tax=Malassezia sympodialis (strain ATCC 42132) TaxID=1230383 RepID=A0A1M8A4X2_MALS4|nr:Similar to S.cerevisiae protein ECM16 (Essential DEAH-box ATP-dependent RNA helicase specific to U3 snoRNP) [Malassezia sympodialis ATCC 42132]
MGGPKRRERFNAKARQSTAGGSSHKGKKAVRIRPSVDADANAPIMDEETRAALAEQDRQRRQLLREGGNDETMKISSKKRRRLDKFIENKLRKEEKARILERLAKSSADIGDRTELVSAATLGTGRVSKESERVQKILEEQEAGSKRKRAAAFQVQEDDKDQDLDAESTSDAESDLDREHITADNAERQQRILDAVKRFEASSSIGSALAKPMPSPPDKVGSALKKGADGQPAMPVIRKRERKGRIHDRSNLSIKERVLRGKNEISQESHDTDTSFDSSEDDQESDANVYDVDKMLKMKRQSQEADSDSVATDELESEEADTDADEEAVLLEAMKRRGLLPPEAESIPNELIDDGHEEEVVESEEEGEEDEEVEEDEEGEDDEEDEDDEENEDDEEGDGNTDNDDGSFFLGFDTDNKPKSKRQGIGESERSLGFKEWALGALKLARPPQDSSEEHPPLPVGGRVDRVRDIGPQDGKIRGPLGQEASSIRSLFTERYYNDESIFRQMRNDAPVRHVSVSRPQALQDARMSLPVVAEEDYILRTIQENPVTVICGETGSGKTTQVPQFLYEAAFATVGSGTLSLTYSANPGMIGITQPRRVAAVSMARRVAEELVLDDHRVSYQIRYDATTSPQTQIKFMTDGVLLRELAQDLSLSKYSVIIVDEAHERSVNTDVLIGMLSRVVRMREQRWVNGPAGMAAPRPLRLVIMSATMRVGDFTKNTTLFTTPPPVVHIGARQHPVTIHFNRRTVQDYVTEAVKKASKIHTRLPHGGILIFMTGQQEVQTVCRKLRQKYGPHVTSKSTDVPSEKHTVSARVADTEAEEMELGTGDTPQVDEADVDGSVDDEALDSDDEVHELADSDMPMHILPLYSLLPSHEQQAVFDDPPLNTRLVVVATNVAETSITIPNIKYVVDCGRSKERHMDSRSQVQSFHVSWISKASAAQRAGRAGRTGPGHCYRLYSSAVFEEHFADFGMPEILRIPVDGLVLQMKSMNIDNVANFPFPTPPDRSALQQAERMLVHIGALENKEAFVGTKRHIHATVTSLGRVMALFPVVPRYAKLLAQGHQHQCLAHAIALVAALSVGDIFEREDSLYVPDEDPVAAKEARRAARSKYFKKLHTFDSLGDGLSDAFRLLSVVGAYSYEATRGNSMQFCRDNFVRIKAMEEINKLRAQLSSLVVANLTALSNTDTVALQQPELIPPSPTQCKVLRQLLCAIYVDRVAVRADIVAAPEAELQVRAQTSKGGARGVPYVALGVPGPVYLHRSSTFFQRTAPEWIVFGEVHRSAPKEAVVDGEPPPPTTTWLKMLTRINPAWLSTLGRSLCTFSQPSETASAEALSTSMQSLKRGESTTMQRQVLLTPRYGGSMQDGAAAGGLGWELPPIKATQLLVHGRWTTQM